MSCCGDGSGQTPTLLDLVRGAWITREGNLSLVRRFEQIAPFLRNVLDEVGVHLEREHAVVVTRAIAADLLEAGCARSDEGRQRAQDGRRNAVLFAESLYAAIQCFYFCGALRLNVLSHRRGGVRHARFGDLNH
jgi:hypothetical protein